MKFLLAFDSGDFATAKSAWNGGDMSGEKRVLNEEYVKSVSVNNEDPEMKFLRPIEYLRIVAEFCNSHEHLREIAEEALLGWERHAKRIHAVHPTRWSEIENRIAALKKEIKR